MKNNKTLGYVITIAFLITFILLITFCVVTAIEVRSLRADMIELQENNAELSIDLSEAQYQLDFLQEDLTQDCTFPIAALESKERDLNDKIAALEERIEELEAYVIVYWRNRANETTN